MTTIKRKIITVFTLLFGVSLISLAGIIAWQLQGKVVTDIRTSAISFAELTSEKFSSAYDLYYVSGSFGLFTSETQGLMARNPAITRMQLVNATGQVLADTAAEAGAVLPVIQDHDLLARLRLQTMSAEASGRILYLEHSGVGYVTLTADRQPTPDFAPAEEVSSIVYPLPDATQRVIFSVSYDAVGVLMQRSLILLAALFAVGFIGTAVVATFFARGITRPLLILKDGAEQIAKGDLDTRITIHSKDETKLLADTFNKMAADLGQALEAKVESERVQKELEVAREIQTTFLPKSLEVPGLEIAAHFEPALEVGGDVYDILPTENGAVIYVGDATGHGTASGIVSALTNAAIATAVQVEKSLKNILQYANIVIHAKTKQNMFITLLGLVWHEKDATLALVSAGHEFPFIYRVGDGSTTRIPGKGGMALGMMKKALFPEAVTIELEHGDILLAFTDGLPEAHNPRNELLGERSESLFAEAVAKEKDLSAILAYIVAGLKTFTEGRPLLDDVTLLVIRRK